MYGPAASGTAAYHGRMAIATAPRTRRNPLWDGYCADPFVWTHGGSWWCVGTGAAGAADAASAGGTAPHLAGHGPAERLFPLLRSDDGAIWHHVGEALERPVAAGDEFWAPAVAEEGGVFHLYYSLGPGHQLRVATSARPEGPYRDIGPLLPPGVTPFAIDPHPVRDQHGDWWLFYARDFLDLGAGWRAGTALAVDRLIGMTRLAGEERTVLRARHDWQRFARDRRMYGGVWDWHTLEGPCVVHRRGRWWCLYSGACWGNATYGVDWAVADAPTGPWDDRGAEQGPRLLRSTEGVVGPGHCSLFTGPDGGDWLAYHAWDATGTVRRFCADPVAWTDRGPVLDGPTCGERPPPR